MSGVITRPLPRFIAKTLLSVATFSGTGAQQSRIGGDAQIAQPATVGYVRCECWRPLMQLHSGVGILQAKFSSYNQIVRITNCSWAVARPCLNV